LPTPSRDYARLSGLGIEFTLTIGLFGWLGFAADRRWQLTGEFPLFLLLGVSFGMGLGMYRMTYQLANWQASQQREREEDSETPSPESPSSGDSSAEDS